MTIEVEGTDHQNLPGDSIEAICKEKAIDENIVSPKSEEGELKTIDDVPIAETVESSIELAEEEVPLQGEAEEQAKEEPEERPSLVKMARARFWESWFKKGSTPAKSDAEPSDETEMTEKQGSKPEENNADEKQVAANNHSEKEAAANEDPAKSEADGNLKSSSSTDVTIPIGDSEPTKSEKQAEEGESDKLPLRDRLAIYRRKRYVLVGTAVGLLVLVTIVLVGTALSNGGLGFEEDWKTPIAVTECGPVEGHFEDDVFVFRGVPYALAPVGDRRWKPPSPFQRLGDCWRGTKQVHEFAPRCYQKGIPGIKLNMSEDCLFLNVYTPSLSTRRLRPVVVYILGGSLMGLGEEDLHLQPSPALARRQDVVMLTFDFRRNVFGFLALDQLSKSVHPPTSGNYGFLDQVAVLKWVQRNIQQFGGDPNKVTVFGHGAGATSALLLMTSGLTKGLLSKVWISGASVNFPNRTLDDAIQDNLEFLSNLGCTDVVCMKNKTSAQVMAAVPNSWYDDAYAQLPSAGERNGPSLALVDGHFLRDYVYDLWASQDYKVPIVIGSNLQEFASRRVLPDMETADVSEILTYIRDRLNTIDVKLAEEMISLYIGNDTSPAKQLHTMISDVRVTCPLQLLTRDLVNATEGGVHFYVVDHVPNALLNFSSNAVPTKFSPHGLDVAAILGQLASRNETAFSSHGDLQFQHNLQELFYNFVYTGTPSLGSQPLKENPFTNYIGANVRSRASQHDACAAWEKYGVFPTYAKMN